MKETGKHPGGRPPIISTPEEMEQKIEEYFDTRKTEYATDEEGNVLTGTNGHPIVRSLNAPSVTGLALFLGYADRHSLYDNEKKEKFSHAIKAARAKVEEWIYQSLMSKSITPSVGIFMLKQFGYSDKQEIKHTGTITPTSIPLTPEEEEHFRKNIELARRGTFYEDMKKQLEEEKEKDNDTSTMP